MLKLISIVNTVVIVWLLLSIDSLSGRVYGLQQRGVPAGAVDDGGDAAEQPEVDGERAAQPVVRQLQLAHDPRSGVAHDAKPAVGAWVATCICPTIVVGPAIAATCRLE